MTDYDKPILVTGSIRSGTTWTGRMIAKSPKVAYIHEPFSPMVRSGINPKAPKYWFFYICNENGSEYQDILKQIIRFNYFIKPEIASIDSSKDVLRATRDYVRYLVFKAKKLRPLIKDPISIFSVEWFVKYFNFIPIILIRHPAAFVASILIRDYELNFENLFHQPLLMRDYLSSFESQILEYSDKSNSGFDKAILFWNCVHHVISIYQRKHPDWIFIRHKDLSIDPINGFQDIYQSLGLDYSEKIRGIIERHSNESNPGKPLNPAIWEDFKRNGHQVAIYWKDYFVREDIKKIKDKTAKISGNFYTEDDW